MACPPDHHDPTCDTKSLSMHKAKAYSAASATSRLASDTIPRRDSTEHDVRIEILFCGVCHSDLHQVRNESKEFMPTTYPVVPGHEIVGRVSEVGSKVTRFKPGDLAGVGCLVDSDRTCPQCQAGLENFCPSMTLTYNSPDKHLGGVTYGGYSDSIVVNERFVVRVPANLELAGAAPLLCAGITTYSPLRPLEGRPWPEGRNRWPGRPRSHGRQVRTCTRCTCRDLHNVGSQARRRLASWRRRGRRLPQCE